MLTRLKERLLVRLMPYSLLDSMHVVYRDCAEFCRSKERPPFIHPIEMIGKWLHLAERTGWTPLDTEVWLYEEGEDGFE